MRSLPHTFQFNPDRFTQLVSEAAAVGVIFVDVLVETAGVEVDVVVGVVVVNVVVEVVVVVVVGSVQTPEKQVPLNDRVSQCAPSLSCGPIKQLPFKQTPS